MTQEQLAQARSIVGSLLQQPTDNATPEELHAMVLAGIAVEQAKRRETKGGGCTLTLNSLLALAGDRVGKTIF